MEQTITVRFVCDILDWNWTDLQLSHNFPTLAPLAPNRKPQLGLTFTMGNTQAISNDFYLLPPPQQQQILEECMHHKSISWSQVAYDASHRLTDEQFLVDTIKRHKNGTAALPSTPLPNPDGKKRGYSFYFAPFHNGSDLMLSCIDCCDNEYTVYLHKRLELSIFYEKR